MPLVPAPLTRMWAPGKRWPRAEHIAMRIILAIRQERPFLVEGLLLNGSVHLRTTSLSAAKAGQVPHWPGNPQSPLNSIWSASGWAWNHHV